MIARPEPVPQPSSVGRKPTAFHHIETNTQNRATHPIEAKWRGKDKYQYQCLLPPCGGTTLCSVYGLFSLMLARAAPDMDCEIVFDPQEWRAAYIVVKRCPPPVAPPRLGEVILLVASLGGYFARKHDGPPGAKAMWTGLQRLRDFVIALDAQQDVGRRCV